MAAETREFELKIEVAEADLRRLALKPALERLAHGAATTRTLRSIYFDTPDKRLAAQRIALRVRDVAGSWIQTVKRGGPIRAGLSTPVEVEALVSEPWPDLRLIQDRSLRAAVALAIEERGLTPVFETVILRESRLLRTEAGDLVELALDSGEVRAGGRVEPLFEVEIELKSGAPEAVFLVAQALFDAEPLRFSTLSKAERGYRLAAGAPAEIAAPRAAGVSPLRRRQSTEQALREIVRDCAAMMAVNLDALTRGDDPEAVHQFRIGLRRLRSALKAWRPLLRRGPVRLIEDRARALFRVAGDLRDADVLLDEMLDPASLGEVPGLGAARAALAEHRQAMRVSVRGQLAQARAAALVFELGGFAESAGWRPEERSRRMALERPVRRWADQALAACWRDVARRGRRIGALSIPQRHDMRKALKELRYLSEFFAPLYRPKRVKPFVADLKRLQTLFGALSDAAMAEKLTPLLRARGGAAQQAGAEILARRQAAAETAWRAARKCWRRLAKDARFWE